MEHYLNRLVREVFLTRLCVRRYLNGMKDQACGFKGKKEPVQPPSPSPTPHHPSPGAVMSCVGARARRPRWLEKDKGVREGSKECWPGGVLPTMWKIVDFSLGVRGCHWG